MTELFVILIFFGALKIFSGIHLKKVADPHPQKYTYRSFLFEILFFILAVGALVFELGIMGYLS